MYYYKKHLNNMDQLFDIKKIIELRHELHQNPELSDYEINTSKRIVSFLKKYKPDTIIENVGEHKTQYKRGKLFYCFSPRKKMGKAL